MHTIYSKIIWGELGLEKYKIHEEPLEKTQGLILDWIKKNPIEKVEKVLYEDLSYLSNVTYENYYDGPFYGINQREKDKRVKRDDGTVEPDLIVHDTGVLPTILHIAIKTGMEPSDFIFMAKVLEAYYEKPKPKPACNSLIKKNQGEEL